MGPGSQFHLALDFGWTLLAACLFGFFGGRWLDARVGNEKPFIAIAGVMLGIFVGLNNLYRNITRIEQAKKGQRGEGG